MSSSNSEKTSKTRCINLLSGFFKGRTLKFLTTQIKLANRSSFGRRWSANDKSVALSIYHASPKAFRILSKLFILPCEETLKKSV